MKELRNFLLRGNVLDLAVAVVIGGAFGAIVTSLVNDIIMPLVGVLLGGLDFSAMAVQVGEATVAYGLFIQAIVNFIVIGTSIFFVVKGANHLFQEKEAAAAPPPGPTAEETLLTEIRDLLKERA
ncbi:MAG: large-conductance mechanosensitive channel protein MscL [Anaerolineae bacterium]|nr:large-conductance mechanosensitive channel protein MscL [Anaerolineae bacterium]MCB9129946.1 large-conductance mechanosensitive channel protein MscL [Anaerolineales bacterium]MCB0228808.1 large-conductance mechanosensitive channel protein MscL [Anaerolineae bacterium]MCB0235017.1 large-conductance mechanosensitive channel protein MscL [Anaerolineae bacterium]MCB0238028.1 large-conductance mechanosensitive channel protein MscL [Anaerolineae bacterium]